MTSIRDYCPDCRETGWACKCRTPDAQPSSTDEVERVALAVASEIDAIDDELANTSALAVPDKQEFRRAASERIARAAIAAMVTKP
jgi:hypothetical protein